MPLLDPGRSTLTVDLDWIYKSLLVLDRLGPLTFTLCSSLQSLKELPDYAA